MSRGDLIDYKSFGDWFAKIEDPILNEFLKAWGKIEVEGEPARLVQEKLASDYKKMKRRFAEYKGYLAEVCMIQILFNCQRKTLPGQYLHFKEDIEVPQFIYIDQRGTLIGAAKGLEIDIFASAGLEVWIGQSKWQNNRKVGADVVKHLLKQAEEVKKRKQDNLSTLRLWLFSHDGVTEEAEELLKRHKIFWSTRSDLDALLEYAHLRKLPVLNG